MIAPRGDTITMTMTMTMTITPPTVAERGLSAGGHRPAILAEGLEKRYGATHALRGLDLAANLVVSPPVLFLDEPTTGLDPRSRLGMWDIIADLVDGGTTVLLTTQYLDEAEPARSIGVPVACAGGRSGAARRHRPPRRADCAAGFAASAGWGAATRGRRGWVPRAGVPRTESGGGPGSAASR